VSERLQRAVSNTIEAGYQLDSEAFTFLEMLSKTKDPVALMEEVVKKMEEFAQKPLFIDRPLLEGFMLEATPKPEAELQLLVVHAVLHLLGHDHLETADKADMWAAQGQILTQLGSPGINPPL